jgi:hypothetical protein
MSTAIIQGATGGKSTIPTIPHFKDYALIFDARVNSVLAEPQNAASTLDLVTGNQVWDYLWSNSYWKRLS